MAQYIPMLLKQQSRLFQFGEGGIFFRQRKRTNAGPVANANLLRDAPYAR